MSAWIFVNLVSVIVVLTIVTSINAVRVQPEGDATSSDVSKIVSVDVQIT